MSDFDSGNSVNYVLLDINLYETKRENNWSPIPLSICHTMSVIILIDNASGIQHGHTGTMPTHCATT